jgi:fructose-1,6-bisphosphatase I/sedoheptulose-1,7-bisphosphatase
MSTREKTITEFMMEEQRKFPEAYGRFHGPAESCAPGVQAHQLHRRPRRFGGGTGVGASDERSGRDADEAGRDVERHLFAHQRVWRPSGRHGLGGTRGALSKSRKNSRAASICSSFDPLDGSSNIDINAPVGSIFSVLKAPNGTAVPSKADFLQPGVQQLVRRIRDLRRDHHAGASPWAGACTASRSTGGSASSS